MQTFSTDAFRPVQPHVALDMSLFHTSMLGDDVALQHAVGAFEGQLHASTQDISPILAQFLDTPNLLEFLISRACLDPR